MDDELHQRAVEIAKRILADSSQIQLYELGVAEATENSRLFSDLVELAKQLLREEEFRCTNRAAA
jgi:transcription termination factor NusB